MPIHLITGVPGHGKTARMMKMLVEASKKGDRPIYAAGIDGLEEGLAQPLDDPTRWKELPDGSLVFVDEAWKWFGHLHDTRGKATPEHILDFAEHRHRGLDFVWTTQGPNQLYPFLRPLIAPHDHCVRRYGTSMVEVYKWGELVEDVKSQGMRDRAHKEITTLPSEVFKLYKSASVHTIKPKIPLRVWAIPGLLIAAAAAIYLAFAALRPTPPPVAEFQEKAAPSSLGAAAHDLAPKAQHHAQTPMDYLRQFVPLVEGIHGSQPIFGERRPKAEPATYCIIAGRGKLTRCRCYTEQVTLIEGVQDGVCRHEARYGRYDPFRAPFQPKAVASAPASSVPLSAAVKTPAGSQTDPMQVGNGYPSNGWLK